VNRLPRVTVLVPARDEEAAIARCIEHIARQDYPANRIELLVVDGASTDATARVARQAMVRLGIANGHVLSNPVATTPSNLNVGLGKATGELVCRVDARSFVEPHHVRTCVEVLEARPEVRVVGGSQIAVATDRHPVSVGIARALNNRWSMGFARYRSGRASGPADTVYLGAFRTDELREAGGWDERLPTNQDYELNRRMASQGVVWFDERLRTGYVPRASLRLLWEQYRRFGAWKARYWRVSGDRPQPRQQLLLAAVPVAAVVGLAALRRHPVATVAAGLAAAVAVEVAGSDEPVGDALAHGAGVAAVATVGLGWWTGVVGELLRPVASAPEAAAR
jgi:cellulose synthase/poly-beta-1,6-N-acetylglucosamine synthase-like glycosyltransferase